jgi:aspartyl/asparaginyl beta-hydroxylase (cupin superfamily)
MQAPTSFLAATNRWLQRVDSALIERFAGDLPVVHPNDRWPWIRELEERSPRMLDEYVRYSAEHHVPHNAELISTKYEDPGDWVPVAVAQGAWRSLPLQSNRRDHAELAPWFPTAFELLRRAPRGNAGFSVLEAHSSLTPHRDPNRGSVRLLMPLNLPGGDGDCGLRVDDEVVPWVAGTAVVFDLSATHEVWNDTDDVRVAFAMELPAPLPWPLVPFNAVVQRTLAWHPSYRQIGRRAPSLVSEPKR